jgi:uncharacterized protein YgiM (DUF1202 family)
VVNVPLGPHSDYEKTVSVAYGEEAALLKSVSGWYMVKTGGGLVGWISGDIPGSSASSRGYSLPGG